jgi:hypothetical protein
MQAQVIQATHLGLVNKVDQPDSQRNLMNQTLHQCEMEVEQARVKLASHLAALRAPGTSLVEQVKRTTQNKLENLIEDLKARAASNPAAALTIVAGVAWQLIRRPPISTALIGAGLYSLFRNTSPNRDIGPGTNYFHKGQERLKEQVGEFAASASSVAADVGDKLATKTDEVLKNKKQNVREWSNDVRDDLAAAGTTVENQAGRVISNASRILGDAADHAGGVTASTTKIKHRGVKDIAYNRQGPLSNIDGRDQILLGLAGVAVAAALGVACQKRITQQI